MSYQPAFHRFAIVALSVALFYGNVFEVAGAELAQVTDAAAEPLLQHIGRLREALDSLGEPLDAKTRSLLDAAAQADDDGQSRRLVQQALDPYCLFGVNINPESRVKVAQGPVRPTLKQNSWRQFLVKVHNEAGVTAGLKAHSPNAQNSTRATQEPSRNRWLDLRTYDDRPMSAMLSGVKLEYRIVLIYSRDAGKRAAVFSFDVGQGSQDIGFRNDVIVTFDCR